ncbi:unnamed protein product, partial [Didymodactylos carnosus]
RVAISTIIVYGIPMSFLAVIYLWISQYVRTTTSTVSTVQHRMHIKRHTEMLKRVLIPVFILLALGTPCILFIVSAAIENNGTINYLCYRISFFFVSLGTNIMPIAIILLTPNLKAAIGRRRSRKITSITVLGTKTLTVPTLNLDSG